MKYKNKSEFILFTSKRNMTPGTIFDLDEQEFMHLKKYDAMEFVIAIVPKPIEDTKETEVHATTPSKGVTRKKTTVRIKPSTTKKKATVRRRNGSTKSSI